MKLKIAQRLLLRRITKNPYLLLEKGVSSSELSVILDMVIAKLRRRCKKDLYYLAKYILGYSDMVFHFHKPISLAIEACNKYVKRRDLIEHIPIKYRQRLFLLFRGCFKTTLGAISHTIQLLLIDPDLRILLAYNKLDNSKETLKVIKHHFMHNELFRLLFPEYCPTANKDGKIEWGTSVSVTLPNRTNFRLREGSIDCAGVDTGLTSRHYEYHKKDDIVTDKSVTTEEQIKASIDWDRLSISLFDRPEKGFTDWYGTRYDYRDAYGIIMKRLHIYKLIIPAIIKEKPVFSERFSLRGLEGIRSDQGAKIFANQYLLDPIGAEDQEFKEEWLTECVYTKFPKLYAIVILVDPASRTKKTSDKTAIVVHAIDKDRYWYVVDGVFDKLNATQRVNAVYDMAYKWRSHLKHVSYENNGFQDTDKTNIERKMKETGFHFTIKPVTAAQVGKKDRIRGLIPYYEHGVIKLPDHLYYWSKYENRQIDIVEELKFSLMRFPQCTYFDLLDAQAQQLKYDRIRPFKKAKLFNRLNPGSFDWYRAKLKKYDKNRLKEFYDLGEVWDKIKVR